MALTNRDVQIIMGMIARGDKQHDIAAWFGENQARIVEAEQGSHGQQPAAPQSELPPKGAPGPKGRKMRAFAGKALKLLQDGKVDEALTTLEQGIEKYDAPES